MTGEIVSCKPPYYGCGMWWRCECGTVWRHYAGLSGSGWKPDCWRLTRRRAARQHMRWVDDQRRSEALRAALSPEDRAWLSRVESKP